MEKLILCESAELLRSVDSDDGYRALDLENHLIDWLGCLVHRDGKSKSGKEYKRLLSEMYDLPMLLRVFVVMILINLARDSRVW